MEHEGHRLRLRQRYKSAGLQSFAPHEALELLLTYAIPRRDTNLLAHRLLTRFGSLHAVMQASVSELSTVEGIGENAATLLSMILPLYRAYRESVEAQQPVIKNQIQCESYCRGLLEGEKVEKFYVICLDARMRRLNTALISSGDVTEVRIYMRHVLALLNQCGASGAIIAHNHPNGVAEPSQEDLALTDRLAQLLSGVDIVLYDHIIVAPQSTFSFRSNRLMDGQADEVQPAAQKPGRQLPAKRKENAKECVIQLLEDGEDL